MQTLSQFLPEGALFYIKKWALGYSLDIKITKNRTSKLGDYQRLPSSGHKITINAMQNAELFFLVLTHELAHLIAFETYGRMIAPHGKEWKTTFGKMILESLSLYKEEVQPALMKFSRSPKANFMASEDLVRYFRPVQSTENGVYIEHLPIGSGFIYKEKTYKIVEKLRKNYLCIQNYSGKKYIFKNVTIVLPIV